MKKAINLNKGHVPVTGISNYVEPVECEKTRSMVGQGGENRNTGVAFARIRKAMYNYGVQCTPSTPYDVY